MRVTIFFHSHKSPKNPLKPQVYISEHFQLLSPKDFYWSLWEQELSGFCRSDSIPFQMQLPYNRRYRRQLSRAGGTVHKYFIVREAPHVPNSKVPANVQHRQFQGVITVLGFVGVSLKMLFILILRWSCKEKNVLTSRVNLSGPDQGFWKILFINHLKENTTWSLLLSAHIKERLLARPLSGKMGWYHNGPRGHRS